VAGTDPLLDCLLILAKRYGSDHSANAFVAGLPLVDNQLTPDLFVRAASRAHLFAKVVAREFHDISNIVLPAVFLLENNEACVVTRLDRERGEAELQDVEIDRAHSVSLLDLEKKYTGYAIYVKPDQHFDERTQVSGLKDQRHWFWSVLAKSWRVYRDVLLASLLINFFALAMPLFTMNVYDRVVPNRAIETLWVLAIGLVIVFIFDLLMKILRSYFIELASKKSDVLLSASIFERVLGLKLSHRAASVGSLASQLKEFDAIKNFITTSTITALIDLPFVLIFFGVIAWVGGPIVLIPIIIVPCVLLFGLLMQKPLRTYIENGFQAGNQKNAILVESLTAIETIKSMGVEGKLQRIWESVVGTSAFWGQKSRVTSATVINVAAFFQQLGSVAVVIYGVYLIGEGELSMGGLIACVMLTGRILAPLGQVASLQTQYFQARTSFNSLNDIMTRPVERPITKTFLHHPAFSGKIEFRKVNFSYPGQKLESLRGVNFSIKEGEKVAIIGRIGSGKSTVLKMILGLYEPTEGAIFVDDVDLSQLDPVDIRKNAGYVSQDVVLFYGTLRSNILYAQLIANDQSLLRAVNASGVADFVKRFPNGLDTVVGERGENLSGGQRQAIGLARAFLEDPAFYILDEPTSQMDNSSEEFVKNSINELSKNKTVVLVTHKMSMLSLVDRIIVMDHGAIVADGPRDAVLDALKTGKIIVSKS